MRLLLILSLFLVVSSPALSETAPPETRPSLLLITLDTTRADRLGCYGYEDGSTPNLDALARDGVRFASALSPTPLTLPAHASLMTGLVPRRHGVRDNALFRLSGEPELLAERLRAQGYRTAAFVSSMVLDRIGGLDRGFEHYDDVVRVGEREAFNHEERAASQTNDAVFGYLSTLEPPFFLWVHYFDPHLPYVPPAPYRERFRERPYDGEIAFMDAQIGLLLKRGREHSPALLVVVAGDHGESLGEHGEEAHGVFLYQATQQVPLLLSGPGVPKDKLINERIGLVDVAPTLLDLLGLPPLPDTDGRSLTPLLRGGKLRPVDYELETFFPRFSFGWAPLRGLVRGDEKFVEAPRRELYDLAEDPAELHDLGAERTARVASLAAKLSDLVGDDSVEAPDSDPEMAERRRRLESLGYVSGSDAPGAEEAIDPKDGVAWLADLAAGREACQAGSSDDGIARLRRVLAHNPENLPAMLSLARCYLAAGRPADAVATDRKALSGRPDDELVHFNLANALTALGSPNSLGEADEHYRRALELNPRFPDAYLNYAAFLERQGAPEKSLALLEEARVAGVRDPEIETRIAVLELKRGDVKAAEQAFLRTLELNPTAAAPLEAMARITYRQGRFREAAAYFERLGDRRRAAEALRKAQGDS